MSEEEKVCPLWLEGKKSLTNVCGLWSYINTFDGTIASMHCKTWRCEECRENRANAVRDIFISLGRDYELNRFLTLTIAPKGKEEIIQGGKDVMNRYLKNCWTKFTKNMKKNWCNFQFLWVMEWHKEKDQYGELNNPFPHLHVMISNYLPKKRVKKAWKSAGGGFIKISRAKNETKLAEYCCKYMSKDVILSVADMARRTRIWGRSRELRTVDEMVRFLRKSDWELVKQSLEELEKRKYYGKTQREREDLESTCRPILESCIKTSCKDMEAEISAYKPKEGYKPEKSTVKDQCRDKEGIRQVEFGLRFSSKLKRAGFEVKEVKTCRIEIVTSPLNG